VFVFGSRFAVLEPVEHICITYLAILLELDAYLADLFTGWVYHTRIEDCFKDPDLLGFWVPPWFRFRGPLLTSG
jgi:hypothetical protein